MASSTNSNESEGKRKKMKLLDDDKSSGDHPVAEDLSVHARINSFKDFKLKEILSENNFSKSLFLSLEGHFRASEEVVLESAVVLLEKLPFPKDSIQTLLSNADLALNLKSTSVASPNVTDYVCYPEINKGDVKATIIYPATAKHAEKYKHQPWHVFHETPEVYKNVILPHLESQKFSLQWVYNILEHKSEADRIVFEDPDPELGFVLLPDLKWDESEENSIYLIAICHTKDIKSIRDLNSSHLLLLKNIKTKGLDTIFKKYSIPSEKLRIFLHYQPSYYHLHVHFTSIQKQVPGCQFEKAHLLDDVINNIELHPSYYQDVTLSYTLKENDPLILKLKDKSMILS